MMKYYVKYLGSNGDKMHCGARQCQCDSQCKRQVPRSPSQAEHFLHIPLYQYPVLSVFRAMPNASMEQERKKIFCKLWRFHSTVGKCSFFLGSHGNSIGEHHYLLWTSNERSGAAMSALW